MRKIRILIAGIGGVGGYFGALLANHFQDSNEVEIIFYARGKHLKEIQANGLNISKGDKEFIAIPKIATDNPQEIGIVDFIILCTKSYDIETTINQLKVCINNGTIILPLLNGVDSKERIKSILPNNIILDGCVYIVSRLTGFGKVENFGNIETLYFGIDNIENEKLNLLEQLFKQANINATVSKNISSIVWEKYIFIAPTATSTTYFDNSIGEILEDNEKQKILVELIEEAKKIAKAKKIIISNDITILTLNKLKNLPFETTSSMHSDFKTKKQNTELKSLTEYVVIEGKKNKILTPTFERLLKGIEKNVS
ncbi:MAG: 2-dehydropantoate 2-reductase [Flavobacterium sp.]